MYRTLYILLFFIMQFGSNLYSQTAYFNNRYQFVDYGIWSAMKNVIEVDDGYLFTGGTGDTINPFWYRIGIIKIDKNGNALCRNSIGDTLSTYYAGWPGSLIKSEQGSIFLAGAKQNFDSTLVYNTCYLLKLNNDCDTVWTKEYWADKTLPIDSSMHFNNIYTCSNGDLVFTGGLYYYQQPSQIFILRTDSSGNEKFRNFFGSTGINEGYSIIQTPDKGFAIGGYWYIPGSSIDIGDPVIIKTDSLGNQQWELNLGEDHEDRSTKLCLSNDGCIVSGTIIADYMMGNDGIGRIQITKLTYSGDIVWSKKYCKAKQYNYLMRIISLDDGSIVATGSVLDSDPDHVGWILKVDSNGDSLWYRHYSILNGIESENYFNDIVYTSDGGFLACGYIYPDPPDTGDNDAWAIKLDSFGCDTPGCNSGVWIPNNILKTQRLNIHPNPASIHVNFTLPKGDKSYLILYDVYGRKQDEIKVPKYQEQLQLNVSNYAPGLYLGILRDEKEIIGNCKFFVNH